MSSRLAIVTGAGSGLGRAFCTLLGREGGWYIVAADIDATGAEETVAELTRLGPSTGQAERLDVTDAGGWRELVERLRCDWPRLDLAINNAGVCMAAEVGDDDLDNWRHVWEVNFGGVLNGCHELVPWLKESARISDNQNLKPRLINVASIAATISAPAMGAYSASKAAVVSLSETLYGELRPSGVSVTVVSPGFFRTQLLANGRFEVREHRLQAERFTRRATITAESVAEAALRGSARGELYIVMGWRARWLWRVKRWAPRTLHRLIARSYDSPDSAAIADACEAVDGVRASDG